MEDLFCTDYNAEDILLLLIVNVASGMETSFHVDKQMG